MPARIKGEQAERLIEGLDLYDEATLRKLRAYYARVNPTALEQIDRALAERAGEGDRT
jgi:hypothetical protein